MHKMSMRPRKFKSKPRRDIFGNKRYIYKLTVRICIEDYIHCLFSIIYNDCCSSLMFQPEICKKTAFYRRKFSYIYIIHIAIISTPNYE